MKKEIPLDEIYPEFGNMVEKIKEWGNKEMWVLGMLVYGSYARNDQDVFSDLDLMIMISDGNDKSNLASRLIALFKTSFALEKDGKIVLYLSDPFHKIEAKLVTRSEFDRIKPFIIGSRVSDPDRAVLLDKTGFLKKEIRSLLRNAGEKPDMDVIVAELNSFLYFYEELHSQFYRGDVYRTFFQYSLAYFKLASFISTAYGDADFTYSPKRLFFKIPRLVTKRLKSVQPTMDMKELSARKEDMFDLFLETFAKVSDRLQLSSNKIKDFRRLITSSFPQFWRLNDLGYENLIRSGLVYRSCNLRYYPKDSFQKWIDRASIQTIVDLRSDEELKHMDFPDSEFRVKNHVRLPIKSNREESDDGTLEVDKFKLMYREILFNESFTKAVRSLFKLVCSEESLPLLFHCASGVDRTGIISALIQSAAGVPRTTVIRKYLSTTGHGRKEFITDSLEEIENSGGITAYLSKIGLDSSYLEKAMVNLRDPRV